MCNTFPTLDQITFGNLIPIPENLKSELRKRYDERGGKYATEKIDEGTGLPINNCMNTSSWQEAEEELVDAVFNLLVANYRLRGLVDPSGKPHGSQGRAEMLLSDVVQAWGHCTFLRQEAPL